MQQATDDAMQFANALKTAGCVSAVFETLTAALTRFGFNYFLITGVPLPGQTLSAKTMLSGWPPEWFARYDERNYVTHDPVARRIVRSTDPFVWSQSGRGRTETSLSKTIMAEARDFGMHDGFSVPIYGYDGYQACVTMSADRSVDLSSEEQNAIYLISLVAYSKAKEVVTSSSGEKDQDDDPSLTDREREILGWISVGKTNWEVSRILSISEKTVEKHVGSIASKVGAMNRTHAVAEALRCRLIN